MRKQWYQALYEHFDAYDQEPYTQNTPAEVDFLESVIGDDTRGRILDVGCGTGRHTLELTRRGYQVTGLDLSAGLLEQAVRKAEREDLKVEFVQGDARKMNFVEQFQTVIMLCEGGFSLMESDEMDRMILRSTFRALKPGGQLIFTAPNAVAMLSDLGSHPGFDPLTLRERFTLETENRLGDTIELQCTQRYYTVAELRWVLRTLGFRQVTYFAVTAAGYSREQVLTSELFEIGLTAVKPR
jgi:ubiquinone/menaquinone biosynthesis C-methylase UbiE